MSFTGNEDHSITLEEAAKLTRNYRSKAGEGAKKGGFFGKDTLQKILDQESCVGIRIYFGEADNGTPEPVLVGVDDMENDLIEGLLAERDRACPPFCGEENELNS
ncbi:MAG: hypothetical protein ISR82_00160 [Candidatus Marinimicrobia bacterium]|nr:hypothetical protein [Candidatus Neomarinimicrobiota bacterium]MBL7009616.1 hypothetical protein [Candidatus Neomarinimicrobiota bacterium]MBL7029641.1 hypothetical protein [Candidatus Neomarinimicrobiota bacterium]